MLVSLQQKKAHTVFGVRYVRGHWSLLICFDKQEPYSFSGKNEM